MHSEIAIQTELEGEMAGLREIRLRGEVPTVIAACGLIRDKVARSDPSKSDYSFLSITSSYNQF